MYNAFATCTLLLMHMQTRIKKAAELSTALSFVCLTDYLAIVNFCLSLYLSSTISTIYKPGFKLLTLILTDLTFAVF